MNHDSSPLLLTPEAAARELSIGRATLYELIRKGELPSLKIGGSRRIRRDALLAFIDGVAA